MLLGLVIGLGGAFALTRLMSSLLFGVSTTDTVTFGGGGFGADGGWRARVLSARAQGDARRSARCAEI